MTFGVIIIVVIKVVYANQSHKNKNSSLENIIY